jgi:hypothetical protein
LERLLLTKMYSFTTNMTQLFSEEYDTYVQLVSFYLAARLFQACYFGLIAYLLPLVKGVMLSQVAAIIIPSALWIASTHVEMPYRLVLIFVALALDMFAPFILTALLRYSRTYDTPLARRIERVFEFFPAINIEHKVERTDAFVTLVIGYGVVGILYQNAGYGINAFLGKAVMAMVQGFIFNWIYFEIDGENIHVHAIRQSAVTTFTWQLGHLPFVCGYVLAVAAMSKLVVATDAPDTDAQLLTESYEHRSDDEIPLGLRFFYCLGLGVALFSTVVISLSHVHKIPSTCNVPKKWRLVNRAAVAGVFCCLPAAESLNSLQLIAITMGLMFWVLSFEVFGLKCPDDPIIGKGCCTYSARCSKKQLEDATKDEGKIDIVELGRREKTAVDLQG